MARKDDRKTVNMVEIRPHVFEWILQEANATGEKLSKYIGDVLELMYNMGGGRKGVTDIIRPHPDAVVVYKHQEAERKKHLRDLVMHMAALYAENPTEKAADNLQVACDNAGVLYDEVIKVALADPFSSIVAQTVGRTKIEQCTLWMTDIFRKVGRIESYKLFSLAEKEGYGERMIYRVKRLLLENPDTPYIDVVRESNTWWYIMKDKDGNEIEALEPEAIYAELEEEHDDQKIMKAFLDTGQPITIIFGNEE